MKAVLPLFVFIDACGWEIIRDKPFMGQLAPHRRQLSSVFGYSSACVPSILSGRLPVEHRNWCYFVYDPAHSPFRRLRALRWLPHPLTSRRFFRRWLSSFLKTRLNFRGYFDLYNIPFRHISLFDFTEKKSPLQAGGMNRGPNIFDYLESRRISYHVSAPERGETGNLEALLKDIVSERIDFGFLYWPELDGVLHRDGNQSAEIATKLVGYEKMLHQLTDAARQHYRSIRLYVFSDHGMANCNELLDLKAAVEALPLSMPQDYAVVYDSTMARFWFFNEAARNRITQCLARIPQGCILPDGELARLGTLFPDRYFGQLIFLVNEGVLIVPSHMGERPIRGMHGYHPDEPHSYAALCTNQPELPDSLTGITDMFALMTADADLAKTQNASTASSKLSPSASASTRGPHQSATITGTAPVTKPKPARIA